MHGIKLPADYRAFLKYAGDGGAGPYYGIYPIKKWNDFADWLVDERNPGFLALPCPLYPDMQREDDWEEDLDCESPYQGTISLGTQGCTYAMQLVVSGPYAGRVVYVDADGQTPYMVRNGEFLEWYERWLDELLGGYDLHWFGFGIGGTEEDLLRILDQAVSYSERTEAVDAMGRLPALSEKGQQCVKSLLSDSDGAIRAAACSAIRTCNVVGAEEAIAKLLRDDCASARRQAVWALMHANANRWSKHVAERLWDDDEDVASGAFFQLQEAKSLRRDDFLDIIERSSHGGLRYCAANAVDWQQEDETLLLFLLRDENSQVRFYAILGLRKMKSATCLPTIIEILESEQDVNTVGSILKMLGELGGSLAQETLLAWADAEDDFHRLDAVDGLCKLGDERVGPVAGKMLGKNRSPERRDELGLPCMSHMKTIRQLVKESLKSSPNRTLRNLARKRSWWPW